MHLRLASTLALASTAIAVAACVAPTTALASPAGAATPAGPAGPAPTGDTSLHTVVAVLRDQLTSSPATPRALATRTARATAAQNAVLGRLGGRRPTAVQHFVLGNTLAATVTGDQLEALRVDPAVASVTDDVAPAASTTTASAAQTPRTGATRSAAAPAPAPYQVPAAACTGTQTRPQLEPEGLQVIGARSDDKRAKTAAALGYDGTGVKVGFIADALDPANADFRRADGTSAIVEDTSFTSSGPDTPGGGGEAFGDAGTIVAQGRVAHDLADWVDPAAVQLPGGHCWIRVEGVAPGASVVAISALDDLIHVVAAIDHAVTVSHVDVLNESFGVNRYPEAAQNAFAAANAAAVAAGVSVVVSSGDAGVNSTIGSPAASNADGVIAVGATTHLRAQVQTGGYGLSLTGATTWTNDQIDAVSSSGVTSEGRTVDLVAPGYGGWAPCSRDLFMYAECAAPNGTKTNGGVEFFAGTSQAAPFTSGTAALVIQAFRATHGGQTPSPAVVKQILTGTATDLQAAADQQGAGRLDARAAVEAALSWTGTSGAPASVDRALLVPTVSQVSASGAPGSQVTLSVPVQNPSSRPVTVTPTLRQLTPTGSTTATVTLDPTTASFVGMFGTPTAATTTTLDVPPGTSRVRVAVAGAATSPGVAGLTVALYDPTGALATVGLQQSAETSYDEVSVDRPAPGAWTAVVSEEVGSALDTVQLTTDLFTLTPVAGARLDPPSSALSPGGTGVIQVLAPVPSSGSAVYTLDPGTAGGRAAVASNTVPVIVQGVLSPTTGKPASFSADLRGGNGRGGAPSQTVSYVVQVPAGTPTLSADLRVPDCACELNGLFIDPSGQVRSSAVNEANGKTLNGVHQTVAAPKAGSWSYVVTQAPVTNRASVTATLRGSVSVGSATATAPALPTSTGTTLVAGQTVTVPVTVTNPSATAPMTVLIDAQRNSVSDRPLQELSGQGGSFTLPFPQFGDDSSEHEYLVPPGTTSITASTSATTPVQTGLVDQTEGTFVVGAPSTASTPSAVTVTQPGQGVWVTEISQVGPFSALAPSGTGTTALTGRAPVQDLAVTSSTGPNFAPGNTVPVTVRAGQSVQITVTITPPASWVGHTVGGRLVVSTAFGRSVQGQSVVGGDVVALLPYKYTVVAAAKG